jgi:hypothetical protein
VSKQRSHYVLGARAKLPKTSSVDFERAVSTPQHLGAANVVCAADARCSSSWVCEKFLWLLVMDLPESLTVVP